MRTSTVSRPIIAGANILSAVFSPLFVPAYCTALCFLETGMRTLPVSTRLTAFAVVLLLTAVIPLSSLYVLMKTGRISDLDVSDRRQRMLPIIIMVVCYMACLGYIGAGHAPLWFIMYFVSGIVTALVLAAITVFLKWKISMHGAGMGNAIGMLLALWVNGYAEQPMPWLLTALLLITGLVASSRVILNRHTLPQVFAGAMTAAFITFALMTI